MDQRTDMDAVDGPLALVDRFLEAVQPEEAHVVSATIEAATAEIVAGHPRPVEAVPLDEARLPDCRHMELPRHAKCLTVRPPIGMINQAPRLWLR
jgi:hypothetical protein